MPTPFDAVDSLASLLHATRIEHARYRFDPRRVDAVVMNREIAESDSIAQTFGNLDAAHAAMRLSAACGVSHCLADQGNFLTAPAFTRAMCAALKGKS